MEKDKCCHTILVVIKSINTFQLLAIYLQNSFDTKFMSMTLKESDINSQGETHGYEYEFVEVLAVFLFFTKIVTKHFFDII